MGFVSIRQRADECLGQFKLLLKIEDEVRENGKAEASDLNFTGLRADEQLARYEIWASNIGVFADGHAALDYRVRDNEDARPLMINFLGTLWEFLQGAIEALNPTQQQWRDDESIPSEIPDISGSSAISSSFQGTDADQVTAALPLPGNAFDQSLQVIERTIDRLYRLSVVIRQPSIMGQNNKAERFSITDDEGNIIDEQFKDFARDIVAHVFPDVTEKLKDRLASGIVSRRKRFLYRQSHQRKLSTRTVTLLNRQDGQAQKITSSECDAASTIRGFGALVESPVQEAGAFQRILGAGNLPSQTSASGMVRKPIPIEIVMEDEQSNQSTTFTNTHTASAPVQVPSPPKPLSGSKEFECPYCCIMLPIKYAKASKWRRHVMLDLEPYACIFENCPDHKLFFRDRNSWISHMKNSHTTRWICATSPAHPTMNFSFTTEDEYEAHMLEVHQDTFTQSQLTMLKKHSKVPTSVTFRSCPLCGYEPLKEDLRKHTLAMGYDEVPPEDIEKLVSDRITKHLASHLEFVAVKALPWQDVTEDAKDESVESKHAEEGTDQSEDDSSAVHRSMSISSFHGGEQVHEQPVTWGNHSEAEVSDISSPGGSYDEDWGFIPRPEYYGHDRDPVLQTLLRKLYLDTSPYAKSAGGPKLPAYLVPLEKDENFSGRIYALNAIKESLCPDQETESSEFKPPSFPRCFVVYGPGGMGKTQIAAQFVANHRHKFDAVLWVYAENSNKLSQDFKDIAIDLGLISESHVDSKDLTLTRDIVKRWLVNPLKTTGTVDFPKMEKASWLLVFDGVEDGDVLNDFWPYDGPGSILITSRNPHSWTASLELKPFSINEATDYLLKITGRDVTDEEKASVVAIAKRLGGLPLALAQMGGIISHKSISFSEFLRSYDKRESQQELLQWSLEKSRPLPSNYEHNVASVWAFDSLGKGAMLLNILSMLDPDGIPESLFTAKEAENEQDRPEIADLKTDYKFARNELLARSLVTGNKREKTLFIHRLVQDVSRARMGPSELRRVFLACVRLLSRGWPFEMFAWRHGNARWEACEELFSHIQRLKDLFPEIAPSVDSFEDYEFARLLIDAGWYRHERGKLTDAVQFNNMAQSICESMKLRVLEHPEYVPSDLHILPQLNYSLTEIHHNRGCIALEINEPIDALKYHKLFNEAMVRELGGQSSHDDMRLAISWNELGNAYMLNQNWAKGEECFLKSMEQMRKLKSFQATTISLPLANLGLAYWLQEKLDNAVATLSQGLKDRELAFGLDDRISFITGRFLHALGNVKGSQGHQDEALEYHRRTLLHYKTTLGNRHHRTADVFVKVADHNIRLGHYDMALALLDHAVEVYSNSHYFMPEKARASFKRAKALRALERDKDADAELSKCFRMYTQLFMELVRSEGARAADRKAEESDLTDADVNELIAFWSK